MSESNDGALSVNDAAMAFSEILEPKPIKAEGGDPDPVEAEEVETEEPGSEELDNEEPPEKFTIKVDGKDVEVTLDELKNGYQRQSDYTKKTMEVSETRKAADAEFAQAAQERQEYAGKLNNFTTLLQSQLNEQAQTNWQELLDNDPVEYLKQQHLFQQRQASLQQAQSEQSQLFQLHQQEQQNAYANYLQSETQQLVAKIPAWADEGKAKAEKADIRDFLKEQGFSDKDISQVADHRHVLLVRQAMQFAKLIKQAPDATKRVEKAPPRMERPGTSEGRGIDKRSSAMQRLTKSGKVEDAAAVFAQLLG